MDQRDVEWRPSDGIGISTVLVDIRWHAWSRKRSNAFEENIFTSNMNKRSYSSKMFEKNMFRETFATKLNPSEFWLVTPNYARIWEKKRLKRIYHREEQLNTLSSKPMMVDESCKRRCHKWTVGTCDWSTVQWRTLYGMLYQIQNTNIQYKYRGRTMYCILYQIQ